MKTTKAILSLSQRLQMFMKLREIHPRFGVLWELGTTTGLRISDLLSLRPIDIASTFEIKEKKTGNLRVITLDPNILLDVRNYIRAAKLSPPDYLFYSRDTRRDVPMSRQWAHSRIASIGSKIGLYSIGAHSLRKIYACDLYRSGCSIEAIQNELGHKNIATTLLYLRDLLLPMA